MVCDPAAAQNKCWGVSAAARALKGADQAKYTVASKFGVASTAEIAFRSPAKLIALLAATCDKHLAHATDVDSCTLR